MRAYGARRDEKIEDTKLPAVNRSLPPNRSGLASMKTKWGRFGLGLVGSGRLAWPGLAG